MKHVLIFSLSGILMLPLSSQFTNVENSFNSPGYFSFVDKKTEGFNISAQPGGGNEKMLAVVFRNQEFCRAELKDFEFDAPFNVVSATVYFSGTNFKNVEKGTITSNSLKPIRSLMTRCAPGSMVIFDNVKVVGPDKLVRPIQGLSILLH